MGQQENILITTLSTLNEKPRVNVYYVDENPKKYYFGLQQQEPGTKYFLSKHKIDKIIILASSQTYGYRDRNKERGIDRTGFSYDENIPLEFNTVYKLNEIKGILDKYELDELNSMPYYLKKIIQYINASEEIVPNKVEEGNHNSHVVKMINEIINNEEQVQCLENNKIDGIEVLIIDQEFRSTAIKKIIDIIEAENQDIIEEENKKEINIYLDSSGGYRGAQDICSFALNYLLSFNKNIKNIEKYSVDFKNDEVENKITILNKTDNTQELISLLRSYTELGVYDQRLDQFFINDVENSRNKELLNMMKKVSQHLSICDIDGMLNVMNNEYVNLTINENNDNSGNDIDTIMEGFLRYIDEDIKNIRGGQVNKYKNILNWLYKKKMIQQCLVFIESKMSEYIFYLLLLVNDSDDSKKRVKINYKGVNVFTRNPTTRENEKINSFKDKLDKKSYVSRENAILYSFDRIISESINKLDWKQPSAVSTNPIDSEVMNFVNIYRSLNDPPLPNFDKQLSEICPTDKLKKIKKYVNDRKGSRNEDGFLNGFYHDGGTQPENFKKMKKYVKELPSSTVRSMVLNNDDENNVRSYLEQGSANWNRITDIEHQLFNSNDISLSKRYYSPLLSTLELIKEEGNLFPNIRVTINADDAYMRKVDNLLLLQHCLKAERNLMSHAGVSSSSSTSGGDSRYDRVNKAIMKYIEILEDIEKLSNNAN